MATDPTQAGPARGRRGGYSGRLLLRMPESLHAELAKAAEREGSSLNQFIIGALATAVSWSGSSEQPPRTAEGKNVTVQPPQPRSSWTTRLLVANFVVVTVVALCAIVFLIAASR